MVPLQQGLEGRRAEGADGDPPVWVSFFSAGSGSSFELYLFPALASACSSSPWSPGEVLHVSGKFFRVRLKVKLICM